MADEGEYECRASNSIGQEISKVVSLDIIGETDKQDDKQLCLPVQATFRNPSATLYIRVGQEAILECEAEGDQPITVHWSRGGARIHQDHHPGFKVTIC